MTRPGRLHNKLLEMIAVIGLDESTALLPTDPELLSDQLSGISNVALAPQILAAVSGNIAIFPAVSQHPDPTYPPILRRTVSTSESFNQRRSKSVVLPKRKNNRTNGVRVGDVDGITILRRTITRRYSCRHVDFVKDSEAETVVKPLELPLNVETLMSLTTLCFPDECFVSVSSCTDNLRYLVLTDIVGTRTYAVSLCCYIRRQIYRDSDGFWRCGESLSSSITGGRFDEKQIVFVPQCYVFISSSPYFTVMKDCLSRLVQRLKGSRDEWQQLLKEFALQLSMTPMPPAGCVYTQFQLYDVVMTIPAPCGQGRLPIDFNLGIVFQCLDSQTVLLIMTAIMTQQRLLFLSSSYVVLTLVIESFVHFLFPFHWNLTCVPLLPLSLLELVEAPGTFIMGCHIRHRQLVEDIEGLVTINLDNGTAIPCATIDLPLLPVNAVKIFKASIRRTIFPVETWRLEKLSTFGYEETRLAELKEQNKLNAELSSIFLEFMVNLFRNLLMHISPEKRFFHREQFLEAVGDHDRPFYELFFTTDLFAIFLKERLDKKQDLWTEHVLRNKPLSRNSIVGTTTSSNERPWVRTGLCRNAFSLGNLKADVLDINASGADAETVVTFKLPNFLYGLSHHYLDNCYQEVSLVVSGCDSSSDRLSTYLYLRGMLSSARNKKLSALEDFCSLATVNHKLFPIEFVLDILSSMNENERQEFESSTLYFKSAILREVQALNTTRNLHDDKPIVMELNKIPEKDIDLQWFVELLEMLQICNNTGTAERLFHSLTLGRAEVVDPLTFEEFYKCWKENEVEVHQTTQHLDPVDCVLKTSKLIKCCFGTGHILLTQNRLLYMEEGFIKIRPVVDFVNVKSIEKVQQRTFFKEQWGIKIQRLDKREKSFQVSFREETNKWYLLMHEMWSGKILSEETKDPSVLHLAMQNVLIVDAYLHSGEAEISSHYRESLEMSPSLCYFMSKKNSKVKETNELLVKRLDPNAFESKRFAVESVLYTDGYKLKNPDKTDNIGSRIWCGMANGKVRVFDMEAPFQEYHLFLALNKVKCMLLCPENEVWASSFDMTICIIENLPLIACNRIIQCHPEQIMDMVLSSDSRFVYSAAMNGKVMVWNVETKQKVNELDVISDGNLRQILCHKDVLWCCTHDELLSVSFDGKILGKISFSDQCSSLSHLECFAITSQNEIWTCFGGKGHICICDLESQQIKTTLEVQGGGIGRIVCVQDKVWIGTKDGMLFIIDQESYAIDVELTAHSDAICSASVVDFGQQQVVTGSGCRDGKLAIWQWPPSGKK